MTTKYVYSAFKEEFLCPRVVEEVDGFSIIKPKQDRGSLVNHGKSIDTGDVFPNIQELIDERYRNYVPGELLSFGKHQGRAWLITEEGNTVHSAFAHQVNQAGVHYMVSWAYQSQTTQQPYNEDFSPLYTSKEQAEEVMRLHMTTKMNDMDEEGLSYEVSQRDDFHTLSFGGKLSYEYAILPIYVDEGVFEQAEEYPDEEHHLVNPWIHFPKEVIL